MNQSQQTPGGLREYALVLRRHMLMIVAAIVLTAGLTLAFSLHQSKLYQASVQVYLNNNNLAQLLAGTGASTEAQVNPARAVANQTTVATSPAVLRQATRALGLTLANASAFRGSASVSGSADRDVLIFASEAPTPARAIRYVNAFATAYANYQQSLTSAPLAQATAGVAAQLARLQGAGGRVEQRSLYNQLLAKQQQLKTLETLQTAQAVVLGPSTSASLTQPKTARNLFLGLILGLLLGIAAAFVRDAFDTRIRDGDQVSSILGLSLLGRITVPPRELQSQSRLVMQDAPFGLPAEAFRMLRTNLDFATLGRSTRTIVVASAVAAEGKTTTVSNLALTYARAGLRVALVDLDLRRPALPRFFPPLGDGAQGITDVVLGRLSLREALVDVPLLGFNGDGTDSVSGEVTEVERSNGMGGSQPSIRFDNAAGTERRTTPLVGLTGDKVGSLAVLHAGTIPPNIGEFVGSRAIETVLADLETLVDIVLIDTPPLLTFADGAALIRCAHDGVLLVTRLNVVSRTDLREVQRVLESAGVGQRLGYVVTGADEEHKLRAYDRYAYRYPGRPHSPVAS